MKVQYSGLIGIQETTTSFNVCAKCLFNSINLECYRNSLFDDLHPCWCFDKYYKKITESDIFNL